MYSANMGSAVLLIVLHTACKYITLENTTKKIVKAIERSEAIKLPCRGKATCLTTFGLTNQPTDPKTICHSKLERKPHRL